MFFKRLKRENPRKMQKNASGEGKPSTMVVLSASLEHVPERSLHGGSARLMLVHDKTDRSNRTDNEKHNQGSHGDIPNMPYVPHSSY